MDDQEAPKKLGERIRDRLAKRYPQPKPEAVTDDDGIVWSKVERARPWRPKVVGDELVGEYVGKCSVPSSYGDGTYSVVTVRTPKGARTISGTVISNLFEAAGCSPGTFVRVIFRGDDESGNGRAYRNFDLYLAAEVPCGACPTDDRRWEFRVDRNAQVVEVVDNSRLGQHVSAAERDCLMSMGVGDEIQLTSFHTKRIS